MDTLYVSVTLVELMPGRVYMVLLNDIPEAILLSDTGWE